MIRAVLFDMDGTVFDTERIYYRAWVRAAHAVGFTGDMDAVMQQIFGVSEEEIGRFFYRNYGSDFPYSRMLALRASYIEEEIAREGLPLKAGVPAVFDELREKGIACALVSSAPAFRIHDFLQQSGLRQAFCCVISGERVEKSKPAPDIFLLAARELGLCAEECMVVEDSYNGVLAGFRAGMPVVMVPDLQPVTREISPYVTHLLGSLCELSALIPSVRE